jgi:molybdate transport system regulatory protein
MNPEAAKLSIVIEFPNGARLSPEDIAMIDAVRKERSILGASRVTGVSYRKCWLMIDALNRAFESPVFATFPGRRGGGAELTPFGERLVALSRSVERRASAAAKNAMAELTAALNPRYEPRASSGASAPARDEPHQGQSRQP